MPSYDDLIAEHANAARAQPRLRPRGHPGGIGVQPARALAQGRDGADAADAGDRRRISRHRTPTIPRENIRAGVAYLKSLMTRFNDDVSLALAAYNAGPGAVEKYGNTVPPYKETRNYVAPHPQQQRRRRTRSPAQPALSRSSTSSTATARSATRTSPWPGRPSFPSPASS